MWPVIVTIFGDLAQKPGDCLSSGALSRITGHAGIKPEAMRVALHRLRKDNWLKSQRAGRTSLHRLTKFGRNESAKASPRIYSSTATAPDHWHLLVAGSDDASKQALRSVAAHPDSIFIADNIVIAPGRMPTGHSQLLAIDTHHSAAPQWLIEHLCPDSLRSDYDRLVANLSVLAQNLDFAMPLSVSQTAILRTLIVHNWRRLVLRNPDPPASWLPDGWPAQSCRKKVANLLDRLPRPAIASLEETTPQISFAE